MGGIYEGVGVQAARPPNASDRAGFFARYLPPTIATAGIFSFEHPGEKAEDVAQNSDEAFWVLSPHSVRRVVALR
jgi:hypothetical protein